MQTLQFFPLSTVRLLDGPCKHAQDTLLAYLLDHDVDRFLAPYRIEAGLEPKAPKYPNWESMGLDGHAGGHYLAALAQMSAATGDAEVQRRLDHMVAELAEVQRAHGDGYVGGMPGGRTLWAEIAAGDIRASGFDLNGKWVPWYNLHKIFAGLRDAWLAAGRAAARDILVGCGRWCEWLAAGLSDEQMQTMLRCEHGGMNEVLADLAAITGEEKYLALARRFSHRAILDPLLQGEDRLTGLHANTQIPKVIGFGRVGALAGDAAWCGAARTFWDTVVTHRSVAIGGNSVREHFHAAGDFSSMMESREGPETCNTYNMLRLTEQLFVRDPAVRYADYYERALFNHILSSQHPGHGGLVYFTTMRARDYRVYSKARECFWCCVGSGMENHGKYGQFIYAQADDGLVVNLFMASELTWKERGLVVRQETAFPDEPRTRLTFSLAAPARFAVRLRHPGWVAAGALAVRVNGEAQPVEGGPGSYFRIEREWHDGDQIELDLPMQTVAAHLPDGSNFVALLHGPIVLAARTGDGSPDDLTAGGDRMAHIGAGPLLPLDEAPMLVGSSYALADGVRPVADRPLTFTAEAVIRPAKYRDLELVPFYRVHDTRYVVYWRTTTPEEYPALVQRLEAQESARITLEARTLDQVAPGEQQPEVDHRFQGEDSDTGVNLGRRWRDAGGWFGYDLRGTPGAAAALVVTYWGGDGNRRFDLLVNDRLLATVHLQGGQPDRFFDETYPFPGDLSGADGRLRVRFAARDSTRTGAVYGIRLVRPSFPA